MVSHEESLFDNNKYFFPEGAAKVREQRAQEQPWLEVSALRDEEHGTPGLQPVPNEQKYAVHEDKGLYGNYITPAFLSPQPAPVLSQAASFQNESHTADALVASHDEELLTSSQTEAWSQPATLEPPPHWSQPVTAPERQIQWPQPVTATEPQHDYQHSIAENSHQAYLFSAGADPGPQPHSQWSRSTTAVAPSVALAPSNYPEQTYWAQSHDPYGHATQNGAGQQHSYSSLEISSQYSDGRASAWTHGTDGRPTVIGSPDIPLIKENMASTSPNKWLSGAPGKSRQWWIAGGILGLLIMIGAVVGGVVGANALKNADSMVGGGQTPPSENTTITTPKIIRQNSRLAVTGYRGASGNYTLRLFFQDPDNQLRFMDKSSVGGIWTDPVTLDTLDYKPMPNGSIAVGSYLGHDPQLLEFFYVDTNNIIRGAKFNFWNIGEPPKGEASNINDFPLKVAENSSISCYFPHVVSQDADATVRWSKMIGNGSDESRWYWENDTSVHVAGSPRSGLVLLPVAQTYWEDAGFVYRDGSGRLAVAIRDYDFRGNATSAYSWTKGALSAPVIPAGSAIGAFAVGRPYTPEDLNTYILYQDDDGVIQVVWQDGDDGWRGPETYDALDGAEVGTDIKCLTQGSWDAVSVQVGRGQDMNRCFFQEKGTRRLKEVWFDGNEWRDQGFVPLD
ncbi:hypothetical protein TruAng_009414 [Truncatella angustata]|nr:hypothetical protein TruAng_009414 [Truncatella angustata]